LPLQQFYAKAPHYYVHTYIACLLDPLNAELNPICHLLAILGAHHILNISRIRVKLKVIIYLNLMLCFARYISNTCSQLISMETAEKDFF